MSKYQFHDSDIYLPGTDVPRNRLGIEDPGLLYEIEGSLLEYAYRTFIAELHSDIRFDEDYFKSLHCRTFTSLYDWAGEYRSVDMIKGASLFCRADYLAHESRRIFRQLAQEHYLKHPGRWTNPAFAERLAYYQCELIALHPFYELNGRVTRLFFDLIAVYNGYDPVDYSAALNAAPNQPNGYILASINCVQGGDSSPLQQIVLSGLSREDGE